MNEDTIYRHGLSIASKDKERIQKILEEKDEQGMSWIEVFEKGLGIEG